MTWTYRDSKRLLLAIGIDDAKRLGVELLPGTRTTVTERAYTSPIWYTSD